MCQSIDQVDGKGRDLSLREGRWLVSWLSHIMSINTNQTVGYLVFCSGLDVF